MAWSRCLAAAILLLLVLPSAGAQSIEPLQEKAARDVAELQASPADFVQSRASQAGIESEAEWARDYVCDTVEEGAGSAGVPEPDLPVCPRDPDVSAVPPEPEQPVAYVEPIEEGVLDVVEEAIGVVEEIADEPANAIEVVLGFVGYLVGFVMALIGGVLASVGSTALALLDGLGSMLGAAGAALDLAIGMGVWLLTGSVELASSSTDLVGDVIGDAGSGVVSAVDGAVQGIGDAVESAAEWLEGLLGSPSDDPVEPEAPAVPVSPDEAASDLLSDALDAVEKAAP